MSATSRARKGAPKPPRDPDDFYATPEWVTKAIVPYLAEAPSGFTLDPCAGDGAILRALGHGIGLEVHQGRFAAGVDVGVSWRNALGPEPWPISRQVVMNPPYSLAMPFVERALIECNGEVAALLRLNWLETQARAAFHKAHPSDVYILSSRPSFTGGGTDSIAYAWFVWGPRRGNRWFILDAEKPKKRKDA